MGAADAVIEVKAPDGKEGVSFGQVPAGRTSGCRVVSFNAYSGVAVEAASAGSGTVDLTEDADNLITVYSDRSFTFVTKSPPASVLLLKAAGIEKGSGEPNKNKVGKVSKDDIRKIAEMKIQDMNAYTVEQAMLSIEGSARSMGLDVVG